MRKLIETKVQEFVVRTGQKYLIPEVVLATLARCPIAQVRLILSRPSSLSNGMADGLSLEDGVKMEHAIDVLYRDRQEIKVLLLDILDFYVKRYIPLPQMPKGRSEHDGQSTLAAP